MVLDIFVQKRSVVFDFIVAFSDFSDFCSATKKISENDYGFTGGNNFFFLILSREKRKKKSKLEAEVSVSGGPVGAVEYTVFMVEVLDIFL